MLNGKDLTIMVQWSSITILVELKQEEQDKNRYLRWFAVLQTAATSCSSSLLHNMKTYECQMISLFAHNLLIKLKRQIILKLQSMVPPPISYV